MKSHGPGRVALRTPTLYSVIAMQILNLTYLGKICPEISSEIVFDEEEWKVSYCCARKTKEVPETWGILKSGFCSKFLCLRTPLIDAEAVSEYRVHLIHMRYMD